MEEGDHDSKLVDVSDGQWIPRNRFDQVNNQLHDLRTEIEALKAPAEKGPSYADLNNAVELGEMSQAEADEIKAQMIRRDAVAEVTSVINEANAEKANSDILRNYVSHVPDLDVEGSDINNRVVREYQDLLAVGLPANMSTQVAAVRSVLGPPELLKQKVEGRRILETHAEAGGSTGSSEGKSDWDKIPPRNRQFYERAIRAGAYASQEVCVEEAKAAGII